MSSGTAQTRYVWWAAAATMFFYAAGYATIGFGLLFFGVLWRLARREGFPWRATPLDPPLAVWAAALLLAALASPYRTIALEVTAMLLLSGAVYYGSFVWLLDRAPGARPALLRVWAIGTVPAALAGLAVARIMNVHAGPDDFTRAMIPQGVGPNGLGTTLMFGSILALGLACSNGAKVWERGAWLVAGIVALAGLAATESRASFVGWAAGIVTLAGVLAWARSSRRARIAGAAVVVAAAVIVTAAALLSRTSDLSESPLVSNAMKISPPLVTRWINVTHDFDTNRSKVWGTSLQMVAASPWLGTGFGTFEAAYSARITRDESREPFAFNLALNLAAETGLLGLYAAVWVAVAAVGEWRRQGWGPGAAADVSRPMIVAVWVALLADQMLDNTLFSIGTSAALWLLLALLVVPAAGARSEAARDRVRAAASPKEAPVLLS